MTTFIRKILYLTAVLLLLPPCMQAENKKSHSDSLKMLLKQNISVDQRLSVLHDLSIIYHNSDEAHQYNMEAYYLATRYGSLEDQYLSVAGLCSYFFNKVEMDSVRFWAAKMDNAKLTPQCHQSYFDIFYFKCSSLLYDYQIELAFEQALVYQKKAFKMKSINGEIACYELLSDIYNEIEQPEKALEANQQQLLLIAQDAKTPRVNFQIQVLTNLLSLCSDLKNYPLMRQYLQQLDDVLNREEQNRATMTPVERCRWLYYCYQILYNAKTNNAERAQHFVMMARNCKKTTDWYVDMMHHYALSAYYDEMAEYDKALAEIDAVLRCENVRDAKYFLIKADLLAKTHNYQQATKTLKEAYQMMNKSFYDNFIYEFNQFQSKCNERAIERNTQAQLLKGERQKNTIIIIGLSLLLALLVLIFKLDRRSRNLRKSLELTDERLRLDQQNLRQRRRDLSAAYKKAYDNGRLKSIFLSNMTHKIRTPLNAIVGFSDIIYEVASSPEQKEYASIVKRNSQMLLVLINDILDIGRLDAGKIQIKMADCNLLDIINEVKVAYMNKPGVRLNLFCNYNTIKVKTDWVQLQRVLHNLLSNAYKFTQQGEINIHVSKFDDKIEIRIADTGCGIKPEYVHRVFERFEKEDKFTQGTGLGLSICFELVKRLSCKIYVDTSYTAGACFVLEMPIKASNHNAWHDGDFSY